MARWHVEVLAECGRGSKRRMLCAFIAGMGGGMWCKVPHIRRVKSPIGISNLSLLSASLAPILPIPISAHVPTESCSGSYIDPVIPDIVFLLGKKAAAPTFTIRNAGRIQSHGFVHSDSPILSRVKK